MKRHSYKKNNIIKNKRKSKINGGRPPVEDNEQCREIATLNNSINYYVKSVAFHPTEPLLATGSMFPLDRGSIRLWRFQPDGSTPTCVATMMLEERVTSVVFHPTLPLLATGSEGNTAKLWRFNPYGSTLICVATLDAHRSWVDSVAFHPTLPLLAVASLDSSAQLWRFEPNGSADDNMSATCVSILRGHIESVLSIVFHPTLPLLATGSADHTAKLWRFDPERLTDDNILVPCVATTVGQSGYVNSVAFHPTAPILATASKETAKLWRFDLDNLPDDNILRNCVATLVGHGNSIRSVVFHLTAPLLATRSSSKTAKLWRFNPDGSTTVVATLGGVGHRPS